MVGAFKSATFLSLAASNRDKAHPIPRFNCATDARIVDIHIFISMKISHFLLFIANWTNGIQL